MSPVYEGLLDGAAIEALVADLEGHADVLDVFVKGGARTATDAVDTPLRTAFAALRVGAAAVQVRYRFAGAEWRDTLLPTAAGVRLVRVQTPV